ncbi:MAG: hypothetical protein R2857_11050 [Vampirovibrionales bacterium]
MAVQAKLDEINQYVQGRLQDVCPTTQPGGRPSATSSIAWACMVQRTVTDTPGPDNHLTAPRQRTIYLIETTNGEPADIYQAEAIEGLSTDLLYLNLDQRNFQRTMAEYRYLVHGGRQVFGSLLQQTANGIGESGNPQAHKAGRPVRPLRHAADRHGPAAPECEFEQHDRATLQHRWQRNRYLQLCPSKRPPGRRWDDHGRALCHHQLQHVYRRPPYRPAVLFPIQHDTRHFANIAHSPLSDLRLFQESMLNEFQTHHFDISQLNDHDRQQFLSVLLNQRQALIGYIGSYNYAAPRGCAMPLCSPQVKRWADALRDDMRMTANLGGYDWATAILTNDMDYQNLLRLVAFGTVDPDQVSLGDATQNPLLDNLLAAQLMPSTRPRKPNHFFLNQSLATLQRGLNTPIPRHSQ